MITDTDFCFVISGRDRIGQGYAGLAARQKDARSPLAAVARLDGPFPGGIAVYVQPLPSVAGKRICFLFYGRYPGNSFSFYLKKVWTKSFRYKFHEKLNVV